MGPVGISVNQLLDKKSKISEFKLFDNSDGETNGEENIPHS